MPGAIWSTPPTLPSSLAFCVCVSIGSLSGARSVLRTCRSCAVLPALRAYRVEAAGLLAV